MTRYRHWRPDDPVNLAGWVENELKTGEFDEAIAEMIERNPISAFGDVIEKLIRKGEFDNAVRERAEALGMEGGI